MTFLESSHLIWGVLAFIGLFVGAFGTLIGAAGGFLLVPILLFMYPSQPPSAITSTTLTVAFFNALSGSVAYGRLRRIDYRSGLFFALTAVPGAVVGAFITDFLSRAVFQYIFAAVLIAIAGYLMLRPRGKGLSEHFMGLRRTARHITDSSGEVYSYSFNLPLAMGAAFMVGLVSAMLGIGGGIVHVPALTQLFGFPAHVATATSHFVVAITTFSAIDTHLVLGTFSEDIGVTMVLSVGAVIGAQFGARLSQRVSGVIIVRLLAAGLAIVAIRLLVSPL